MSHLAKKTGLLTAGLAGFGLNTYYALTEQWSLQEFCWSTWLAALCFSWMCVVVGLVRVILNAKMLKSVADVKMPFLNNLSSGTFLLMLSLTAGLAGWVVFHLYCYLFGFYGIFLSVFAEMTPHDLFGRNGFINSDFFTPVVFLAYNYWSMILGLLASNIEIFRKTAPLRLMLLPFKSNEILKIHLMVVGMPFLALLTWFLFKEAYQPITIIVLLWIFYLLPKHMSREAQK